MPVKYFGSGLIPAPLVTMNKVFIRDANNNILHPDYTFSLRGTIVNVDSSLDSPQSIGYTGMEGVLTEQARIRQIFSQDGGLLEIIPPVAASGTKLSAFCRLDNVSFEQSPWVNRCDYTVVLKATAISGINEITQNIDAADENWNIVENVDGTFGVSHELRATGATVYNSLGALVDPLSSAKAWCQSRRYLTDTNGNLSVVSGSAFIFDNILSNISNPSDTNFWNYACIEGIGIGNRSWQLTETMIYYPSGSVREQWNANVSYNEQDPRIVNIGVNGLVVGFADRASNLSLRNTRAKSYFDSNINGYVYLRVAPYVPSGYTLNPTPVVRQIGYERSDGVLTYNYGFNASSGTIISGAIQENITVSDVGLTDVFAIIPVPHRSLGPVVQPMQTYNLPERTINITALFTPITSAVTVSNIRDLYLAKPDTSSIISALAPNVGNYYCKQNVEEWNPIRRQYSRVVSWVIRPSGTVSTSGVPSLING